MKNSFAALSTFLILTASSCIGSKETCIDESKIRKDAICTREYQPVCGCDGKTYGNQCEAEAAGLLTWKAGACVEKKD